MTRLNKLGLLILLGLYVLNAYAGNSIREQAIAQHLVKQLPASDITWLTADGQRFLAIQTPAQTHPERGSAILVHDLDGNPNLEPVIFQLRTQLPQHGWQTLSLQMPLLEKGATLVDYLPLLPAAKNRIGAAVAMLKQQGRMPVVLVGYGLGALMAINAIPDFGEDLQALVALSLPITGQPAGDPLAVLTTAKLPILDLHAEMDWPEVAVSAPARRIAAKANPNYRQVRLDAAGHAYEQQENLLVKRIYSWLAQVTTNTGTPLQTGKP